MLRVDVLYLASVWHVVLMLTCEVLIDTGDVVNRKFADISRYLSPWL